MDNSEFTPAGRPAWDGTLEPVSSGATCETFKFQRWGKWFLLKRLKPDQTDGPMARSALEKEFDLGIRLDHPGLVRYFEKGEDGTFLVEEFIDGQTLSGYLQEHGPLSGEEARRIFGELADTVSYLHSVGIVHSDIKPDNIVLTRQGTHPKLVDLGFSSQYSYAPLSGGTVSFSAPEQFSDGCDGDVRADVYSLGKVLEVLAPGRFRQVVRKATADRADDRYDSPEAMVRALRPKRVALPLLLALLLLSLIVFPFLRHTPSASVTPIRDTLYVRDTTRAVDTIVILSSPAPTVAQKSPQDLFRQEVRQAVKRRFDPFYASYTRLTRENYEEIQPRYLALFDSVRLDGLARAGSWAEKYPDQADAFRTIAMDELLLAIRRYQNDMLEMDASSAGAGD